MVCECLIKTSHIKEVSDSTKKEQERCTQSFFFSRLLRASINILLVLLLQGKKIKCSASQAKHRLFIGNVPRKWTEEDLKKIVADVGPGVTGVELLKVIFFF